MVSECLSMRGSCPKCKQEILRSDLKTHVCPQNRGEMVSKKKAKIDQLKQENARQKNEIDTIKQENAKLKQKAAENY